MDVMNISVWMQIIAYSAIQNPMAKLQRPVIPTTVTNMEAMGNIASIVDQPIQALHQLTVIPISAMNSRSYR